jgi:glycosyltransferase involved in cell wall biosynthesis
MWQEMADKKEIHLIVNKSLAEKTLKIEKSSENLTVIPEYFGFKLSCLLFVPPVLLVRLLRGTRKFHLSVGGAYFIEIFEWLRRCGLRSIGLHTSIGSRSVQMAVGGNKKYLALHHRLLQAVDKVDCLYDASGFPGHEGKFVRSPGSFSWRFTDKMLKDLECSRKEKLPIAVFSGTLIPQKNYRLAIVGFSRFLSNYPLSNARLHIFAPEVNEIVRSQIEELNKAAGKDIIFLRQSNELVGALADAQVFLSLQNFDNYPSQSLIEAMANGCNIIATDVGETRVLVDEGGGNYLIPVDEDALFVALGKAFGSTPMWNKNNAEKILAEHSVGRYAEYFYKNFIC